MKKQIAFTLASLALTVPVFGQGVPSAEERAGLVRDANLCAVEALAATQDVKYSGKVNQTIDGAPYSLHKATAKQGFLEIAVERDNKDMRDFIDIRAAAHKDAKAFGTGVCLSEKTTAPCGDNSGLEVMQRVMTMFERCMDNSNAAKRAANAPRP